jgi:hypothetical protein
VVEDSRRRLAGDNPSFQGYGDFEFSILCMGTGWHIVVVEQSNDNSTESVDFEHGVNNQFSRSHATVSPAAVPDGKIGSRKVRDVEEGK